MDLTDRDFFLMRMLYINTICQRTLAPHYFNINY